MKLVCCLVMALMFASQAPATAAGNFRRLQRPRDLDTLTCSVVADKNGPAAFSAKTEPGHLTQLKIKNIRHSAKVHASLFTNVSSLMKLNLSGNRRLCIEGDGDIHIPSLQTFVLIDSSLSPCNKHIRFQIPNLRFLDVSSNNENNTVIFTSESRRMLELQELPSLQVLILTRASFFPAVVLSSFGFVKNLRFLDVSFSRNVTFGDGFFPAARNIKTLNMTNSSCSLHGPSDFSRAGALDELNLSNNSLTFESVSNMKLPSSLRSLNLSCNRIEMLSFNKNSIFDFIGSVEVLDLSYNSITDASLTSKKIEIEIVSLNLSYNKMKIISVDIYFPLLLSLDLSHNELDSIGTFVFRYFLNVTSLNLSFNKLKYLERQIFEQNDNLKILLLRHNSLKQLDVSTFYSLRSLFALDVSNNYLTNLTEDFVYFLTNLRLLDVSCNRLSNIAVHLSVDPDVVLSLRIHGNPWQCGCLDDIYLGNIIMDEHLLFSGRYPSCYVGNYNASSCDDVTLTSEDYVAWEKSIIATGMPCLNTDPQP